MSRVSVIMPAYQAEKYIDQAIQSIVNQSFTDWELIIVDNGSRDRTADLVACRAANEPRIRLIAHHEPIHPSQSRNRAATVARGEFLAFLDADDIAYPQRLQKQVDYLEQYPQTGLVAHWLDIIDENGLPHPEQWVWRKEKDAHLPIFLLFDNAFALSSVMMRRSVWEQLGGFPKMRHCEDYALWSEASRITGLHILPEKLGARREYAHSLSRQESDEHQQQARQVIARNLSALGITPSDEELTLHRQLRHRDFVLDDKFAQSARKWLELLLQQNQKYRAFPQGALEEVLGEIWYDYWHLRHQEGFSVMKNYFASLLWSANKWHKNLLLTALIGKSLLRRLIAARF